MSMKELRTFSIIHCDMAAPPRHGYVGASFPDFALAWILVALVLFGMSENKYKEKSEC